MDRHRDDATVDRREMLSFQKLRVYQRSIEFLAAALDIIGTLPRATPKPSHHSIIDGARTVHPAQNANEKQLRMWCARQ